VRNLAVEDGDGVAKIPGSLPVGAIVGLAKIPGSLLVGAEGAEGGI
jgi:hypothetical protein